MISNKRKCRQIDKEHQVTSISSKNLGSEGSPATVWKPRWSTTNTPFSASRYSFFQLIELSRFPYPFPLVSPKQANVAEIDQQQRQRKRWVLMTNANVTTEIWPLVWCTPPQKVGGWNQRLTLPGKEPRCWLERPNLLAIPVSASEENANLPGAKHKEAYSKKIKI